MDNKGKDSQNKKIEVQQDLLCSDIHHQRDTNIEDEGFGSKAQKQIEILFMDTEEAEKKVDRMDEQEARRTLESMLLDQQRNTRQKTAQSSQNFLQISNKSSNRSNFLLGGNNRSVELEPIDEYLSPGHNTDGTQLLISSSHQHMNTQESSKDPLELTLQNYRQRQNTVNLNATEFVSRDALNNSLEANQFAGRIHRNDSLAFLVHQNRENQKRAHSFMRKPSQLSTIDIVKQLLEIEPKERNWREVKKLGDYFGRLDFFNKKTKTGRQEKDEQAKLNLYQNMRLEEHPADTVLFRYGDPGTQWYVILEGQVKVKIPTNVTLQGDSATPEGLVAFLINFFEDIHWEDIDNGERILHIFFQEMVRLKVRMDSEGQFDKQEALYAFDRAIVRKNTKSHIQIFKLTNPKNEAFVTLKWFKQVATKKEGEAFGELAILSHSKRTATIICAKDTTFATLSRRDYIWIMGSYGRRKLKEIVDFLRGYRIFKKVKSHAVEKIFHYMKKSVLTRGTKIYLEGQEYIDGIYLIQDGEVEVTQKQQTIDQFIGHDPLNLDSIKKERDLMIEGQKQDIRSQTNNKKLKEVLKQSQMNKIGGLQFKNKPNPSLLFQKTSLQPQKSIRKLHKSVVQFDKFDQKSKTQTKIQYKFEGENCNNNQNYAGNQTSNLANKTSSSQQVRLFLLGKNEIVGLEEIIRGDSHRKTSVIVASTQATVHFMKRDHFEDCVNVFRFQQAVYDEFMLKYDLYLGRLKQTRVFQQKYVQKQQKMWKRWARENENRAIKQRVKHLSSPNGKKRVKGVDEGEENDENSMDSDEIQKEVMKLTEQEELANQMLQPCKGDDKIFKVFKRDLLESTQAPMSWRTHRKLLLQTQAQILNLKNKMLRQHEENMKNGIAYENSQKALSKSNSDHQYDKDNLDDFRKINLKSKSASGSPFTRQNASFEEQPTDKSVFGGSQKPIGESLSQFRLTRSNSQESKSKRVSNVTTGKHKQQKITHLDIMEQRILEQDTQNAISMAYKYSMRAKIAGKTRLQSSSSAVDMILRSASIKKVRTSLVRLNTIQERSKYITRKIEDSTTNRMTDKMLLEDQSPEFTFQGLTSKRNTIRQKSEDQTGKRTVVTQNFKDPLKMSFPSQQAQFRDLSERNSQGEGISPPNELKATYRLSSQNSVVDQNGKIIVQKQLQDPDPKFFSGQFVVPIQYQSMTKETQDLKRVSSNRAGQQKKILKAKHKNKDIENVCQPQKHQFGIQVQASALVRTTSIETVTEKRNETVETHENEDQTIIDSSNFKLIGDHLAQSSTDFPKPESTTRPSYYHVQVTNEALTNNIQQKVKFDQISSAQDETKVRISTRSNRASGSSVINQIEEVKKIGKQVLKKKKKLNLVLTGTGKVMKKGVNKLQTQSAQSSMMQFNNQLQHGQNSSSNCVSIEQDSISFEQGPVTEQKNISRNISKSKSRTGISLTKKYIIGNQDKGEAVQNLVSKLKGQEMQNEDQPQINQNNQSNLSERAEINLASSDCVKESKDQSPMRPVDYLNKSNEFPIQNCQNLNAPSSDQLSENQNLKQKEIQENQSKLVEVELTESVTNDQILLEKSEQRKHENQTIILVEKENGRREQALTPIIQHQINLKGNQSQKLIFEIEPNRDFQTSQLKKSTKNVNLLSETESKVTSNQMLHLQGEENIPDKDFQVQNRKTEDQLKQFQDLTSTLDIAKMEDLQMELHEANQVKNTRNQVLNIDRKDRRQSFSTQLIGTVNDSQGLKAQNSRVTQVESALFDPENRTRHQITNALKPPGEAKIQSSNKNQQTQWSQDEKLFVQKNQKNKTYAVLPTKLLTFYSKKDPLLSHYEKTQNNDKIGQNSTTFSGQQQMTKVSTKNDVNQLNTNCDSSPKRDQNQGNFTGKSSTFQRSSVPKTTRRSLHQFHLTADKPSLKKSEGVLIPVQANEFVDRKPLFKVHQEQTIKKQCPSRSDLQQVYKQEGENHQKNHVRVQSQQQFVKGLISMPLLVKQRESEVFKKQNQPQFGTGGNLSIPSTRNQIQSKGFKGKRKQNQQLQINQVQQQRTPLIEGIGNLNGLKNMPNNLRKNQSQRSIINSRKMSNRIDHSNVKQQMGDMFVNGKNLNAINLNSLKESRTLTQCSQTMSNHFVNMKDLRPSNDSCHISQKANQENRFMTNRQSKRTINLDLQRASSDLTIYSQNQQIQRRQSDVQQKSETMKLPSKLYIPEIVSNRTNQKKQNRFQVAECGVDVDNKQETTKISSGKVQFISMSNIGEKQKKSKIEGGIQIAQQQKVN